MERLGLFPAVLAESGLDRRHLGGPACSQTILSAALFISASRLGFLDSVRASVRPADLVNWGTDAEKDQDSR